MAGLLREADSAAGSGDLNRALNALQQATALTPDDAGLWMRLAAMHRGANQPGKSLAALHRALAITPLDFTALLMKASLLQHLNHPDAGEAWGNALAQKPETSLPPQVEAAVRQGEQRHAEWITQRERRMAQRMAPIEERASDEERKRIARFRSNVLRRTRPFHSNPTHFHYPELAEREFHPRRLFPWIEELEAATDTIAAELSAVMASERAELVPYIQYADHVPLDQWRPLNKNPDWTAIHLWKNGVLVDENARHCPQTLHLLAGLPQPPIPGAGPNAMFSLLAPQTHIPPHVGVNNARLVCHLPLIVPEGCWFRVGAETHYWRRGEALVFDDTIEHEAMNPTGELRIVFIFDVWHPDLSAAEKAAVTALIEADGAPDDAL